MRLLLRCSLALLVLLGAVACGGSDGEESATTSSTTTTTIPSLAVDQIDADASPYCGAWAEIRKHPAPAPTGDVKKDEAARKAFYTDLLPLVHDWAETAPKEIDALVTRAVAQIEEMADTGSDAPLYEPDAATVQQSLAQYAVEHCKAD